MDLITSESFFAIDLGHKLPVLTHTGNTDNSRRNSCRDVYSHEGMFRAVSRYRSGWLSRVTDIVSIDSSSTVFSLGNSIR